MTARVRKVHARATLAIAAMLLAAFAGLPQGAGAAGPQSKPDRVQQEFARALKSGKPERVRALIDGGADVNQVMAGGLTPLMIARDEETVKLLAAAGADVNAVSQPLGQSVLMLAVTKGNPELVRALLEAGADVKATVGPAGTNALSAAFTRRRPSPEMLRLLLDAGADPNDGHVVGMPLLVYAAMGGHAEAVKVLVDGGANVEAKDAKGTTPLLAAVRARRTEVVRVLVAAGADVNASAAGPDGTTPGPTALDIARTMGDDELVTALEKAGARGSARPPPPDSGGPLAPGIYGLDCGVSGSPPPPGAKLSCSVRDEITASGTEVVVASKAFFAGGRPVPTRSGCTAELGNPGVYTIRTTTTSTPWHLVCRSRLRQTSGETNWIVFLRKGKTEVHRSERTVTVSDAARKAPSEEPRAPPGVVIVRPAADAQFAFSDARTGVLEIPAEASVTGDCGDAATWRVDDVGESKRSILPAAPSNEVAIRFEGLPEKNSDFGEKRITASACGASASVKVKVFFPMAGTNHPGRGAGETPNWFFYWGQTRAGAGVANDLKYAKEIPASNKPGDLVMGRFDPADQKILLSDLVLTHRRCTDRMLWGGDNPTRAAKRGIVVRPATEIDCFAEVVMHEWQHRVEYYQWAGKEDRDEDGVPREVEEVTVGCVDDDLGTSDLVFETERRKRSWYSCAERPFLDVTDREINAYYAGWKWPVGKADEEDWSRCGKQWVDASACLGEGAR